MRTHIHAGEAAHQEASEELSTEQHGCTVGFGDEHSQVRMLLHKACVDQV